MSMYFVKTSIGYSHIASGKRCQDFSASYHDGERTIIAACDGHGGNVYVRSHLGSKFACDAAINVLKGIEKTAFYKNKPQVIADSIKLNILCEWNSLVDSHMQKKPIGYKDIADLNDSEVLSLKKSFVKAYGTTLNAVMLMGNRLICVSLGDGGCFLIKNGIAISPFTEDEDEPVANVTYSMCQDDAYKHLNVTVHDLTGYDGAIICTDGMINPYQSMTNFSEKLVAPAVISLLEGKGRELEDFVTSVGTRLGIGDDVSLGLIVKDKTSLRRYSKVQKR